MAVEVPRWLNTLTTDDTQYTDDTSVHALTIRLGNLKDKSTKRIMASLDLYSNDAGEFVVAKEGKYNVHENHTYNANHAEKPIELAERYYLEGVNELVFLDVAPFQSALLYDLPILELLRATSKTTSIPLIVGGGIRAFTESDGNIVSVLDIVAEYFSSGADKISIESEAVYAVEVFYLRGGELDGTSDIEQIARVYGSQAIVISVHCKRVYISDPLLAPHHTISTTIPGPNSESYVWYQCTVKGSNGVRDLGVYEFVKACEELGAGEILLNCVDVDGSHNGYDLELITMVKTAIKLPVIASSGAGRVNHFSELFKVTNADAALATGIFLRREVSIMEVKEHLVQQNVCIRQY